MTEGIYRIASLFSGCGGADKGFLGGFEFLGHEYEPLPFEIVWANDIDVFACIVYRAYLG
jgi:DNA (cytosine-5)-methyltransferase 1